ncbi:MAG TPA: NAD(P)-binding domain-containing protein, partial [Conexibacter sp.]|nr:NAD(P)-binding domain-containing protein [Conexibacter sp.]
MARVLIVGCGCRGQSLARALRAQGHAVRGTTRTEGRRAEIEAAGAEVWVGDPDRIATISYALADVTILCWLMGSAEGPDEKIAALHGSRLRMLLE